MKTSRQYQLTVYFFKLFFLTLFISNSINAVPLNGTYTVGSGQTYATIAAAITAVNTDGVNGPVIFSLTDASYTMTNSAAPNGTINAITGASSTNTITFKPAPGISPTITITANATQNWGFKLNGSDYVVFDGCNISGGNNKNMTIIMTGAKSRGFVLDNAASNNTIKNCIITGYENTRYGGTEINIGIYSTPTVAGNDNNTIFNNTISKFCEGIYLNGNTTTRNTGNIIKQNYIGSTGAAANYINIAGIIGTYQTSCTISKNEVFNLITVWATTGIELDYSTNSSISRNLVHDIVNTDPSAMLVVGIFSDITNIANPALTISNNMVYRIAGYGNGTHWSSVHGIFLSNQTGSPATSTGVNVYFNSVYLTADGTYGLGANSNMVSGVNFNNYIYGINFENNIIRVSLGERASAPTSTKGYALVASYCGNAFNVIDYNIYYVSGQDNNYMGYKVTGGCVASDVNFATWQTYTGSQETHSTFGTVPAFTSTTDLHLTSYSNGVDIAGITVDYDGSTRGSPAKIGADDGPEAYLPIYLASFIVYKENENVNIKWQTSSEINNDYFTVQRSFDGEMFEDISIVKGAGNSTVEKKYQYIDKLQTNFKTIYYRIKQTDYDGKYTYSVVKNVNNNNGISTTLNFYPNPGKGDLLNIIVSNSEQKYNLEIYSLAGQLIFSNIIETVNSESTVKFAERLNPGVYLLKLQSDNEVLMDKFYVKGE